MAEIVRHARVDFSIVFKVSESEARALDALAGYGDDPFIKVFYEHLGKAYMRNHENGLRSFLQSIRKVVGPEIATIDRANKVLSEVLSAMTHITSGEPGT